ncbi:MAG TPA: 5-methyltetrahydropteroyltriglutamate--homocysteine S-methyltransferase, partial [Pedobacter sp.]
MLTNNLGYPRIGSNRELKKASEQYWSGKIAAESLVQTGAAIRAQNWALQQAAGTDLIPSNDFSFYDQVLDLSLTVGAIPKRYHDVILNKANTELDLYFAMARGYQRDGLDITAMEMTKWFDTNYHYIVPEFHKGQTFKLFSSKIINEYNEAKRLGIKTKPVIIGPVSYLLLGKEKQEGFHRIELIRNLLPVYIEILKELVAQHVEWVQFDEPFLVLDLTGQEKAAYIYIYTEIKKQFPQLKVLLTTYFEGLKDNLELAASLPVSALHIDLVRAPEQLDAVLAAIPKHMSLSLGLVDGRNIWKNDFEHSLDLIKTAVAQLGESRVLVAPGCSLIHSPCDLDLETTLKPEIKQWMAFAKQKVEEVALLKQLSAISPSAAALEALKWNKKASQSRRVSPLIHDEAVKQRVAGITLKDEHRESPFSSRRLKQHEVLNLPLFPTTTIGSFPQTPEVRGWTAKFKKGILS